MNYGQPFDQSFDWISPDLGHLARTVQLRKDRGCTGWAVHYFRATIPIHDPQSGESAVQDLRNWIGSLMRSFEFLGGMVEIVKPGETNRVPDGNLVTKTW